MLAILESFLSSNVRQNMKISPSSHLFYYFNMQTKGQKKSKFLNEKVIIQRTLSMRRSILTCLT